jgi:hypothetical protein
MPIIEDFVLSLSDQQLITGLLLVTLAYPKYYSDSSPNLPIAADLCVFSMITHFATISTIKSVLRKHSKMAPFRMLLVFISLIMWLVMSLTMIIWEGMVNGVWAGKTTGAWKGYKVKWTIYLVLTIYVMETLSMLWLFW